MDSEHSVTGTVPENDGRFVPNPRKVLQSSPLWDRIISLYRDPSLA